jgi:hypothetical protein
MSDLRVTPQGLSLQGRPLFLQAGTFHYFRLPHPDLWLPALTRMRLSGFNAVVVPFPWAYHSPAPGFYDFTGPRDVAHLLDVIDRVGLWSIPHIGPWVGQGLDAGGVPAWVVQSPGLAPDCEGDPQRAHAAFRRHLSTWWSRLLGMLNGRDHVLFLMADAGRCSDGSSPQHLPPSSLVELLADRALDVPWALPYAFGGLEAHAVPLSFTEVDAVDLAVIQAMEGSDLVWINVALPPVGSRSRFAMPSLHEAYPREALATLIGRGGRAYALTPTHEGVTWGWWGAPPRCEGRVRGAPVPESWTPSDRNLNVRRLCLTAETLAGILIEGNPEPNAYATPPAALRAARSGPEGTAAFVGAANNRPGRARISLGTLDRMVMTEDVFLSRDSVRLLPLNWTFAGGKVLTTTMEPVLHTSVAGRHLLILLNEEGGSLTLSDDFRVRHQRGPVEVERVDRTLTVRLGPSPLTSLLLDGPEAPLQLLALDAYAANRVWPLDDRWRTTPARRATWNPEPEEPARGVVIGPDFVLPQADGGYRFLVRARGLGYRWGPWRGSDPRTWLAPVPWRAPRPVDLPELEWASRRGAPEVLPDYPDRTWQSVAVGACLSSTALDMGYGFLWYRAHFSGDARAVILRCPDACDLFLNGEHVAALSSPPDTPVTTKRIPLPGRSLKSENVLAFLVEQSGRPPSWDLAAMPHGLLSCELDGGQVSEWRVRQGLSGAFKQQGFAGFGDWEGVPDAGTSAIVWHRAAFDLAIPDDTEVSLFLRLESTPRRAYLHLNGRMIDQVCHPHDGPARVWLPEGVLNRRGRNELLIAQWTRGASPGLGRVRLESGPVMRWQRERRAH